MRGSLVIGSFISLLGFADLASAAEIEIRMLNKGSNGAMVFEPALTNIQPGDTVKFVASDKGHNAEAIDGMLPDGAKPFVGKINEEISITLDEPGVYGYKCKPHYAMGMVGMIVVGSPVNEDQAKSISHPGKAKQAFSILFDELAATKTAAK